MGIIVFQRAWPLDPDFLLIPTMPPTLTSGNAALDSAPFRGWFVGDLPRWAAANGVAGAESIAAAGLRSTHVLEVKWGVHPRGQPRPEGWAPTSTTIGLSVLVSGEFRIVFRSHPADEETDVVLRTPGDYVLWGPDAEHTWIAVEDSIILTVRWPAGATVS
jgi:hypothetical protein